MGRTEMVLKLTMSPVEHSVEQITSFVEQTTKLIPDCDLTEFSKILDMKGYKRQEQGPFIDCFKNKMRYGNEGVGSAIDIDSPEIGVESSRIKKLEKLIKKRYEKPFQGSILPQK